MNCSKRHLNLVDAELAEMFSRFGAPIIERRRTRLKQSELFHQVISVKYCLLIKLQDAIRTYGHLAADIYPLNDRPKDSTRLELSYYGLTENDLEAMPASLFFKNVPATCRKWT